MLRFAVHDHPGALEPSAVAAAHALGPDAMALRGKVTAADGMIECRLSSEGAAALAIPFDAGSRGRFVLQTCLLPQRDAPYDLVVELARYQIKTFLAKSEEWQMFDHTNAEDAVATWEKARIRFTESLVERDPAKAEALAFDALVTGLRACEGLAVSHADILLHRRFGSRPASSATLGVRIWPGRDGSALREFIESRFDLAVLPVSWREIEVEEDTYRWGPLDRWVEWARGAGKPIVLGPLVDFSKSNLPDWMDVWRNDFDTTRDLLYDFMERVVQRYAGAVTMWNLASGINVNDNFVFKPSQMLDLVRTARLLVRQYRRGARAMIELRDPFGEAPARYREAMAPLQFVTHLRQEGVQIDATGVQVLFGTGPHGTATRSLMQVSNMLDRLHLIDGPIVVSAMGVPSEPGDGDERRGWYRSAWSTASQERWIRNMFCLALSKPQVESVFWTDVYDHGASQIAHGGLLDGGGAPKPGLRTLIGLRRRLRKPLGTASSSAT